MCKDLTYKGKEEENVSFKRKIPFTYIHKLRIRNRQYFTLV